MTSLVSTLPRVSIIIPTYNRPHLLARTVESALQAGSDVEVILVDDASTDETARVCQELQNRPGVRVVRLERNQSVAGARNIGILASSGEYIAFLDDDDLRVPGSLDKQVAMLENNRQAGFCCGAMIIGDGGCRPTAEVLQTQVPDGDAFWRCLALNFPVLLIAVVVRRECFSKVGLFEPELNGIDDWDMLVRLSEIFSVIMMDEPVCIYRAPTPESGQGSSSQARQLARALRQQEKLLQVSRARQARSEQRRTVRREARDRAADTLLWNALQRWKEGYRAAAWANVHTALRMNPRRAFRLGAYRKLLGRLIKKD